MDSTHPWHVSDCWVHQNWAPYRLHARKALWLKHSQNIPTRSSVHFCEARVKRRTYFRPNSNQIQVDPNQLGEWIRVPLESGFFLSLVKGRATWHFSFPNYYLFYTIKCLTAFTFHVSTKSIKFDRRAQRRTYPVEMNSELQQNAEIEAET